MESDGFYKRYYVNDIIGGILLGEFPLVKNWNNQWLKLDFLKMNFIFFCYREIKND